MIKISARNSFNLQEGIVGGFLGFFGISGFFSGFSWIGNPENPLFPACLEDLSILA